MSDPAEPKPPAKKGRPRRTTPAPAPAPLKALGHGASSAANRRAAAILEVLAGERTPRQVAAALGISLPYFYLLERKALNGLVRSCEPQPKGPPGPTAADKLTKAERRLARSERECQRLAALVRVTQRAVGLPAAGPPPKEAQATTRNGKSRRRRRPVVRALRAAEALRKNSSGSESTDELEHSPATPDSGIKTGVEAGSMSTARFNQEGRGSQEVEHGG